MWLTETLLQFCRDDLEAARIDLKHYETGTRRQSERHPDGQEVDTSAREIERLRKRIISCQKILTRAANEQPANVRWR